MDEMRFDVHVEYGARDAAALAGISATDAAVDEAAGRTCGDSGMDLTEGGMRDMWWPAAAAAEAGALRRRIVDNYDGATKINVAVKETQR